VSIVKALRPPWTTREAANHLMATANDLGARGLDPLFGHGLTNTAFALATPGPLTPSGEMPKPAKTSIKLIPTVGGATIKVSKGRTFFAKDPEGYVTVMDEDTFLAAVKPTVYRIWSYSRKGNPTKVLKLRVKGLNPPRLQLTVTREGDTVLVRIPTKVPNGALLTLNTYNGRRKDADEAVLNPNVSVVGVKARNVTHVEVCYAVFDESLGCRKVPVPR
jgi:hypothetical protein